MTNFAESPLTHEASQAYAKPAGVSLPINDFAMILRMLGAVGVTGAMMMFLLEGWHQGDDISRYYQLLMQTLLLAGSGFALSYGLKENKGARLFFGLGLISITVNMTTLGALIFSQTQWGSALVTYPDIARWQAVGWADITMALAATAMLCLPVGFIAHRILARNAAREIALLCIGLHLLLLLPVRESFAVGLLALVAITVPVYVIHRILQRDATFRTHEGLFVACSLLLPGSIIVFRTLWLYPIDEALGMLLALLGYCSLRYLARHFTKDSAILCLINLANVVLAVVATSYFSALMGDYLEDTIIISLASFAFAGLLLAIAQHSVAENMYRYGVLYGLAIIHLCLLAGDEPGLALLTMASGLVIIMVGRAHQLNGGNWLGGTIMAAGLLTQFQELLKLIDLNDWPTLAILGGGIIITGSLIERHGAYFMLKIKQQ